MLHLRLKKNYFEEDHHYGNNCYGDHGYQHSNIIEKYLKMKANICVRTTGLALYVNNTERTLNIS